MHESTNKMEKVTDLKDVSRWRATGREFARNQLSHATNLLDLQKVHFRPSNTFGARVAGGQKESPKDAEAKFTEFCAFYKEAVSQPPFQLDAKLPDVLEVNFGSPELHPIVHTHFIQTESEKRAFHVTRPLEWAICLPGFPLPRLREIALRQKRDKEELQSFLIHFAMVNYLITANTRLLCLFEALRLPIRTERLPEYGALPLTVVHLPAGTVRPPDQVILDLTEISGDDKVDELLDYDAWMVMRDPLLEEFRTSTGKIAEAVGLTASR